MSVKEEAFKLANKIGDLETDHEVACTVLSDITESIQMADTVAALKRIKSVTDFWNRRADKLAERRRG